jgi:hypothetical protein
MLEEACFATREVVERAVQVMNPSAGERVWHR